MQLDQYSQPEELLADDSFLNWYFKTGGGEDRVWEEWMNADEGHMNLVRQAVELLELSRLPEREIPREQIERATDRLLAGIEKISGNGAAKGARRLPLRRVRVWIAAACCVGLLGAGFLLYSRYDSRSSEIRTEYGQLGEQVLPDGTEVTMNANSRLEFAPGWKKGTDREVWVKGEAFFHVSHTPEKSRFIVHMDRCVVIVTGTRFNVVNRPGKENVMLEEGSVTLRATSGKVINMRPGDFVAFDQDQQPELSAVRPDSLMAWKKRMVFLDNTPIRELVNIVYDQYGVQLHLAGDSTGSKTITAILPNNNLEVLLKGLETTSEFEVIRKDGVITIAARSTQK